MIQGIGEEKDKIRARMLCVSTQGIPALIFLILLSSYFSICAISKISLPSRSFMRRMVVQNLLFSSHFRAF